MIKKEITIDINDSLTIKLLNKNNDLNKYLNNNYIFDIKLFCLEDSTNIFSIKKYLKKYNINYRLDTTKNYLLLLNADNDGLYLIMNRFQDVISNYYKYNNKLGLEEKTKETILENHVKLKFISKTIFKNT
jgi:hypothetical protein